MNFEFGNEMCVCRLLSESSSPILSSLLYPKLPLFFYFSMIFVFAFFFVCFFYPFFNIFYLQICLFFFFFLVPDQIASYMVTVGRANTLN